MVHREDIFISAETLHDKIQNGDDVVIFDASWFLPTSGRSGHAEYEAAHIEGALFFDIDALSDKQSDLPHMLPSSANFSMAMCEMGVSDQDEIVIYDNSPLFSAARARWTLKHFGAVNVKILEGGLAAWKEKGFALTERPTEQRQSVIFYARGDADIPNVNAPFGFGFIDYQALQGAIDAQSHKILDARSYERFLGEAAEPRPNLRAGHMPGAISLPFNTLLNEKGVLKETQELAAIFDEKGLKTGDKVITSCGSGVTAAVISLGLELIDHQDHQLYDGSWSEYGSREESKIVQGE